MATGYMPPWEVRDGRRGEVMVCTLWRGLRKRRTPRKESSTRAGDPYLGDRWSSIAREWMMSNCFPIAIIYSSYVSSSLTHDSFNSSARNEELHCPINTHASRTCPRRKHDLHPTSPSLQHPLACLILVVSAFGIDWRFDQCYSTCYLCCPDQA